MPSLFTESGEVIVRSCSLRRADQGNIAGEIGTFAFDLRDRRAIDRANSSGRPMQLQLNNVSRAEIILTGVATSMHGSHVDCFADFVVNRHLE